MVGLTLDNLTDTNLGLEIAAAHRGVEPSRHRQLRAVWKVAASQHSLRALAVRSIRIIEVAGVLHGDGVALLRLVDAIALGDQLLGDTHVERCSGSEGLDEETGSGSD